VLAIGINDTRYRSAADAIKNYAQILDALPQDRRVIVSAILPINKAGAVGIDTRFAWIQEFNSKLKQLASERDLVTFLDNNAALDMDGDSRLDNIFDDGDGLHLNSVGNEAWATNIRRAIQKLESAEQQDASGAADCTFFNGESNATARRSPPLDSP
jgi:lysophospholipase L1-like esterase